MARTASKSKKVSAAGKRKTSPRRHRETVLALLCGALLGLSAPGIDQWYLAWVGLAPLFLLCVSSPSIIVAGWRALLFGFAYNLVYLNWFLALHPLDWMGFAAWQSIGIAIFCWMFVCGPQAILIGLFGVILKALPLTGGALPAQVQKKWCLPAFLLVPPLWVMLEDFVFNQPDLLCVPWTMIEYSQYKMLGLIQICSTTGGAGLALLMVLVNVAVACLVATFTAKASFKPFCAQTRPVALGYALGTALLTAGSVAWGFSILHEKHNMGESVDVSIVQGNTNITMQKTEHRYTSDELMDRYEQLAAAAPTGICVFTESSLPTYLRESPHLVGRLKNFAARRRCDLVVGSIDGDASVQPFNAAFGITKDGQLLPEAYRKRFLVPVGEYTPEFVKYLPEFLRRLTDTPAGTGFGAGTKPVVLNLSGRPVAPLICFETISPGLAVSSVRNGGQLLVNTSDLAWFHDSMVGEQTTAFAVFRAVENRRFLIYAANTGPSVFVDPWGKIAKRSPAGKPQLLTCRVNLMSDLTTFTQWFH